VPIGLRGFSFIRPGAQPTLSEPNFVQDKERQTREFSPLLRQDGSSTASVSKYSYSIHRATHFHVNLQRVRS
jgi:hypothetical protein